MSKPKNAVRSAAVRRVYQLHIQLEYLEPAIWRRLWVPDTVTLDKLDRIIQTAMGWKNTHMHAFAVGAVRYAIPDPDWPSRIETRDERVFDLGAVLANGTTEFIYTYDFGDDWRHRIQVEAAMEPGETLARFAWPEPTPVRLKMWAGHRATATSCRPSSIPCIRSTWRCGSGTAGRSTPQASTSMP